MEGRNIFQGFLLMVIIKGSMLGLVVDPVIEAIARLEFEDG